MAEYYLKMCQEHPLVVYIEDPYANADFKGYQKLAAKIKATSAHIQVGIMSMI